MLDPFNDGEAMTDMSNPNNCYLLQHGDMNGHVASMDGRRPGSSVNMQVNDLD